jgi:hypothetical protein
MDDLVAFIRARLDEDERVARAVKFALSRKVHQGGVFVGLTAQAGAEDAREQVENFLDRHDPSRVLAEVAAKRAIVDLHDNDGGGHECPDGKDFAGTHTGYERDCLTVLHLAAVYASNPDYREEWRP